MYICATHTHMITHKDSQTDSQTDRQTNRQTDRQTQLTVSRVLNMMDLSTPQLNSCKQLTETVTEIVQ